MDYVVSNAAKSFIYKVYGWMGAALSITALTAYAIFKTPALFERLFNNTLMLFVIFIAQLGLVVALSATIERIKYTTAMIIFIAYSILMGITMSAIFYAYTIQSIYITFAIAAGMFAAMALYGYYTKHDLTQTGSYARMALFGLIIAMLVNFYFQSSTADFILSLIGVGVFTLLTAYDMQRIVQLGYQLSGQGREIEGKFSLVGALSLYLDFVNLFLMMLRFTGNRRD